MTEEDQAQRRLRRLQNFIFACQLPFEAAMFRPDDLTMGFCLRSAGEQTLALTGSFDACIGYLMGYLERALEMSGQPG